MTTPATRRPPTGAVPPPQSPSARLTPAGIVLGHPRLVLAAAVAAVVLAGLAAFDGGSILLTVDEPIQRWVQDRRADGLDTLFRSASRLGSNVVVFSVAAALAAVTWRRCRLLALAIIGAALLRPLMEFVVKAAIDRPRPDSDRLVPGTGASHPSGHVLASIALYGLVPAVVAVFAGRGRWWRLSVVVVMVGVPLIAASRVYLGVHWFLDIVGGFLIGTLYLLAVEELWVSRHAETCCGHVDDAVST